MNRKEQKNENPSEKLNPSMAIVGKSGGSTLVILYVAGGKSDSLGLALKTALFEANAICS